MEEQRNTGVNGMKLTGKEFEELLAEVYPDERFKRHRHKRLAEEFDLSQATILTWTSRGTPSWIEPLFLMSKKLMEYEMENTNKIREIRKAQGHTLETLSELMGVSQSSIEKVEKGQRRLKQYFLVRAAEALRVDPHDLANGQEVDLEARIASTVSKPGIGKPNILQNRSIQLYKSRGLSVPKDQTPIYTACPSTVWADENAFAVSVPVVPNDLEAVAPWLKPGTVCFCTKQSPFEKGGLVVVDRGEHFVLAQLDGFAETTVKLDPWIGQSFEADPDSVYPVVTIDLR